MQEGGRKRDGYKQLSLMRVSQWAAGCLFHIRMSNRAAAACAESQR